MSNPILFQTPDSSIILLDIPLSIASAQGRNCTLLSSSPLEAPYPSTEPKTPSAKQKLATLAANAGEDESLAQDHIALISHALNTIHESHQGDWCAPRWASSLKRPHSTLEPPLPPLPLTHITPSTGELFSVKNRGVYILPPSSKISLSDCRETTLFHAFASGQKFDLIILDPPWPSRSVRRSHKSAARMYSVPRTLLEVDNLLRSLRLEDLLTTDGSVAVWITNKPSIRRLVLDILFPL
ncbi:hypothetical protein K470DRAFT_270217 [Piedraia hortae CBS 480.64]|uniref:MT-A70-domain-containing protein n=1 Tax=Piedraia hortae CBS 480.64 TaxID=1314780 RepID=A0A6A7C222_9PEZI|nr:hypothetical protein K470DRAFT_270217 [Piedraia hortae CBS 480.64]